MEQEDEHAGIGEGDVRREDEGVAPVGAVEAPVEGNPDGGGTEAPPQGELRPEGQEQVRPGEVAKPRRPGIRIKFRNLRGDPALEAEAERFRGWLRSGVSTDLLTDELGAPEPGEDGAATWTVTPEALGAWAKRHEGETFDDPRPSRSPQRARPGVRPTLDEFLARGLVAEDYAAYQRGCKLAELYRSLYGEAR